MPAIPDPFGDRPSQRRAGRPGAAANAIAASSIRRPPPAPASTCSSARGGADGPGGVRARAAQPRGAWTVPSSAVPVVPSGPASRGPKSHPGGSAATTSARHASAAASATAVALRWRATASSTRAISATAAPSAAETARAASAAGSAVLPRRPVTGAS